MIMTMMNAKVALMAFGLLFVATFADAASCGKRFRHQNLDGGIRQWIVGGVDATKGAYPWQISYQWRTTLSGDLHSCGGTILSPEWILTAAHCIFDTKYFTYIVVAGEHNLKEKDGFEQESNIAEFIVHPGYSEDNTVNDIALLRLKTPLKFNDRVQPACLPLNSMRERLYAEGVKTILSGWGELDPKGIFESQKEGRSPDILQATSFPIVDTTVCNARGRYSGLIRKGMFCAGFLAGGVDACQGDSGGPLVEEVDGRITVVGVVSWGAGCAQRNKPGVYTNVLDFMPWITSVSGLKAQ